MSSPQAQIAPHATATAAPVRIAETNSPESTTGDAVVQDTIDYAPTSNAQTTAPAVFPPQAGPASPTAPAESQTYNDKLNAVDRYWKFKLALSAVLIITGLIGIGCFGWIYGHNYYGYDSYWSLWPGLITWSVSVVWCSICILCFLLRKKAVHPGVRVTMDLLLWLAFIVTALLAVVAIMELLDFGRYGDIGYAYSGSSSNGDYVLADNNTWIWEQDSSYINIARDCNSTRSSYTNDGPTFKDCAEQDAYINTLWREKGRQTSVELTGVVCQFIGLVLHFALFVWACIDTHRYNRTKVSKDAEKLAAGIVQTMIHNGAVVPPPGHAYMRPQAGHGVYYQLPPQQQIGNGQQQQTYPMVNMHSAYRMPMQQNQAMTPGQFHQGAPTIGNPTAGPSSEKGQPRYA